MPEPVRIAFVITELEFGGAERCLANLVTGIDRTRFDPIVCALKPRPSVGKDAIVEQIEAANIPVHFLNLRSPASLLLGVAKLKQLIRQHRAEVVQTFLFHANVIGSLAARSAGVRRIVAGVRVADPSRWRIVLERFALQRVDYIACVSQSVAEFVATKGRFPREKLRVIPNGIDLSQLLKDDTPTRTEFELPTDRRILLSVGRLHRQKGLDWLLEQASELFKRLPDHDLVIVGDGPERKSLAELSAKLGHEERVHFMGWRPDAARLMRIADILLLPSRWEGMPNVLIEAMGIGLPVVATSVEGVDEVLGPLAERQSVSLGDRAAFIDAVCEIASDGGLAAKLGEDNQTRIQGEFALQTMISLYEDLYSI